MSDPQQAIMKGLLKEMKPVQALVMIAIYQDFPERFIPNNGYFFKPRGAAIMKALSLKAPVYYLMVSRLVDAGFLDRRKAKSGGAEYRIRFDRMAPYIEAAKAVAK